jgi:glyoxylase-like metal-dependent hydrolase (beta-lactamase superfamily II)
MVNPLQENCYVVSDESRECVIIDCGAYYPVETAALSKYLSDKQLTPVHLLATHGHLDHNFGNAYIFREYGLKVEVCTDDQQLVEQLPEQASSLFGMTITEEQPPVGRLLADGDTITFGNHKLQVMHTPGHSPGSVLFYCEDEKTLFTGDTLFRMSIGRTDLEGGSWQQMMQSLHRIAEQLPKDVTIFAGHGPQSTIADEIKYNPYFK